MSVKKTCTCLYLTLGKCGLRGYVKILILTCIAMSMFLFTTNVNEKERSFDLGPTLDIIRSHVHIDDLNVLGEASDDEKIIIMNKLRNSISDLLENCTKRDETKCSTENSEEKILTLFTTWAYDKEKFPIHNRTMHNWKMLPKVNLVVFVGPNDKEVEVHSKKLGWDVLPITEQATGSPILPTMFLDVMKKYKSKYYGFANGDILFTDNLVESLNKIFCKIQTNEVQIDTSKGLLIVGRRINIPSDIVNDQSATSWKQLKKFSRQYGKLFQSDAEDYFITDAKYPWKQFLPVAVGRRGIDNWIVGFSRFSNITVIDASESVLCLHQTIESRGNYEGNQKGDYNMDLVKQLNMPFGMTWGKTYCSPWKSWLDFCGSLVLQPRKGLAAECTEYKWTYRLASTFGFA